MSLKGLVLLASLLLSLGARAQSLLVNCTVSVTPLSFPAYASPGSSNADTVGNIAVTCTPIVAGIVNYTITLNSGRGTFTNRTLVSGSNSLNYNIYTDSTRAPAFIWGDGTGGTQTVSDSYSILLAPITRYYTPYGRVSGGQNKPAGSYTDMVTVTVTY